MKDASSGNRVGARVRSHAAPQRGGSGASPRERAETSCRRRSRRRPARRAGPRGTAPRSLVERYDAVKFCIFQRNLSNFRGLVLFCIEADFCNQILIF